MKKHLGIVFIALLSTITPINLFMMDIRSINNNNNKIVIQYYNPVSLRNDIFILTKEILKKPKEVLILKKTRQKIYKQLKKLTPNANEFCFYLINDTIKDSEKKTDGIFTWDNFLKNINHFKSNVEKYKIGK